MFYKLSMSKVTILVLVVLFCIPQSHAQTKKLKRPKSRVGVSSVDTFVRESFDLYDKVYKYDGYAEAGTPLDDEDIDVLEEALTEMTALSESAPDILSDLDGVGLLKQGKATLQINKAKKASNEDDSKVDNETQEESTNISDGIEAYSKYDFVPGDQLIFFDDFANDFIGDFPAKWNTNGSGEVVTLNKVSGRWFEFKQGYNTYFIPNLPRELPEDYTIEFDLIALGVNDKTSIGAYLEIKLEDNNEFKIHLSNIHYLHFVLEIELMIKTRLQTMLKQI